MTAATEPPLTHRLAALSLLLLCVAALALAFDRLWLDTYQRYTNVIEQSVDRLARYRALLLSRDQLAQRLSEVRAQQGDTRYTLAPNTPMLAATELQQQLQAVAQSARCEVNSTQALSNNQPDANQPYQRVSVRLQLNCELLQLQRLLHGIESTQPLMFINALQTQMREIRRPTGQRDGNGRPVLEVVQQLITTLEVSAYMPTETDLG